MAKSRILKRNNKPYLELPKEMLDYEEAEVVPLRDGSYIISAIKKRRASDVELAVLRKLLSIRFEKRTPAYVEKSMTEAEMLVLKGLEKKGMVNVFKGRKYANGVYNIKDDVYPMLKGEIPASSKEKPKEQSESPSLMNRGFLTLKDKNEAFRLSQKLGQEMKRGDVIGIKGFDGKFYVVTKDYLVRSQSAIGSVLKEGMDVQSIAEAAKMDPEGCTAVLRIMAENGEILEKKKGVFAPI